MNDYINNNTKCILFRSPKYEANKAGVDEFLKDKTFLSICPNDKSEYYTDSYNEHHFTNKFTYRVAKSVLGFIGIDFNPEDFILVENIENGEDFSYLKNTKGYDYEVTSDFYVMPDVNNRIVSIYENNHKEIYKIEQLLNQEVENREILGRIAYPVHTAYHRLFRFSHQCCHIKNLNIHNGKKILISCDSYIIPYIPLMIPYCEEVTVLDNRFWGYHYHHFKLYEYTDVIVALSYCNGISKYIDNNF